MIVIPNFPMFRLTKTKKKESKLNEPKTYKKKKPQ